MNKKVTRENIGNHLFEYEMSIVGKDPKYIMDDDKWRFNVTMTRAQYADFKRYAIALMQKTFKFNKTKARETFDWFWMRFGLRIKG